MDDVVAYLLLCVTTRNFYSVQPFNTIEVRKVAAKFQTFWNKFVYVRIYTLGDSRREDALEYFVHHESFKTPRGWSLRLK